MLAALLVTACSIDPHRHFSGPVVEPLWSITNLEAAVPVLIHDQILYVSADRPESHLYALDLTTRKVLWISDFVPGNLDGIVNPTGVLLTLGYPTSAKDSGTRRLYAVDARTGKHLWMSAFNAAKPLFLIGSQIFATEAADPNLAHTLDLKTGEDLAPPSPTIIRRASVVDSVAYATSSDGTVTALDAPNHVLWTARIPHPEFRGPVVSGNTVYYYCVSPNDAKGCQTPGGEITKNGGIWAFDRQTGALRWTWQGDHHSFTGMVADPVRVYVSAYDNTGIAIALDAGTGRQKWMRTVSWNPKDYYFRRTYPDPLLFDSTTVVYFDQPSSDPPSLDLDHLDNKAKGTVLRAFNRSNGEPLWQSTMPWKYENAQAVDGLLVAPDGGPHSWETSNYKHEPDSWLTVLDMRTGKQQWRSPISSLATQSPMVLGDGVAAFAIWPRRDTNGSTPRIVVYRITRDGK